MLAPLPIPIPIPIPSVYQLPLTMTLQTEYTVKHLMIAALIVADIALNAVIDHTTQTIYVIGLAG